MTILLEIIYTRTDESLLTKIFMNVIRIITVGEDMFIHKLVGNMFAMLCYGNNLPVVGICDDSSSRLPRLFRTRS